MADSIVIIGGGQAASSAAAKLRELDNDVSVTMICAEPVLPYQRPPLSKKFLSGEMPLERLVLRPQEWFDDHRINVMTGVFAAHVDAHKKRVDLAGGTSLSYDKLLLAIGSHPRELPEALGGQLEGVHYLRNTADADGLSAALQHKEMIVVGGGYIGLEVAAVAAEAGLKVTVVEMAERILQRVAAPETSDFYRNLHATHGVTILEGAALKELTGKDGKVTGAVLSDGRELLADSVVVGIGVIPTTASAETAGVELENGIAVDSHCRTSDPSIYAAGDCTSFHFRGRRIRLESVPNAIHQAEIAAENMLGRAVEYEAAPWFWSDQYDVKLQIAGLNVGYDHVIVRPGKREGAQSVWYYEGDQLLAVDAMNDAPSFMMARRIIEAGKSIPPGVAEDLAANLKDFM